MVGGHFSPRRVVVGSFILIGVFGATTFAPSLPVWAEPPSGASAIEGSDAAHSLLKAQEFKFNQKDKAVTLPSGVQLTVTSSANGEATLILGPGIEQDKYQVSLITGPDRLVVDLSGKSSSSSKSYELNTSFISRVRTGAHSGKERIVFDLGAGSNFKTTSSVSEGVLQVVVSGQAVVAQKQMIFAKPTVKVAKAGAIEPAAPAVVLANDAEGHAEIVKAIAEEVQQSKVTLGTLQISAIPSGGNSIVAEMNAPAAFQMKRTAPSEYVVRIKNSTLDPKAAVTLISPQDSGAVRSVRPVVQGEDVVLRIFVKPHSALTAKSEGSKIVLAEATVGQAQAEEVLAQLSPDAAEKAGEGVKKEGATTDTTAKVTEKAVDSEKKVSTDPDLDRVASLLEEDNKYTGRLISLDLQDTDIDNALRIIAEVSNLNIIASEDVTGKITLRLIDVPWDQALDVILKTNGLDKVQEGNVVRIAPVEKLRKEREDLKQAIIAEQELEPLQVEYIRISYARAAELKPLVETVISERGTVAYDERTNQVIVKDIRSGIKNVAKLVAKLDLRTPQILLETQIVEASTKFTRDLGSQLDFKFVWSPETGNALGNNFPNSAVVGGALPGGGGTSFPADVATAGGSAVGILLRSADGTKSIGGILSAFEQEGRVRIVSRPSVATTNNKPANIKAVRKIRVRLPDSGLSVATGQGASASSSGTVATETIEAGIVLDVIPQASPDYYVLLDIKAKSSTLGALSVDGIPEEVERSASSTVLVSSGQTFAMGGIYRITDNNDVTGVPFFKDIPALGTFFRRTLLRNEDEELIFFITPRIVEGSFDDAAMRAIS